MNEEYEYNLDLGYYFFETIRWEEGRARLAEYHLERMAETADFLQRPPLVCGQSFEHWWEKQLPLLAGEETAWLRVMFIPQGRGFHALVKSRPLPERPERIRLSLCPSARRHSADLFWRYKFGGWQRNLYYREKFGPEGDVIFLNEKNEVCETGRFNLYLLRGGILTVPPLSCGCLAGVFRRYLLDLNSVEIDGKLYAVREGSILCTDLDGNPNLFVSNALHGLIPAYLEGTSKPKFIKNPIYL
ncbi:MAG: hypothetical protein B0D92_07520 [Spirochaeta sp. LUC14_002_19_P3]|nr:MAG: hypothetical protein B0D92_07520 [Spirochaeta sp. LUC14_002_19_P3]